MPLNEKGYYFTVLMFGFLAAISLQKSVRDRLEGIPVTNICHGQMWFATLLCLLLLTVGLWSVTLVPSKKGFYTMSFLLSLSAVIAVQKKNARFQRTGAAQWAGNPALITLFLPINAALVS